MSNEQIIQKDLLKSDEYFISTNCSDEFSFNNISNIDLLEKNSLQRVASDPVMFQKDYTYYMNLSYNNNEYDDISMQTSTMSLPNRTHSFIEIPTINQKLVTKLKTNQNQLFQTEKYIPVNQEKIISTNSLPIK